ncbi:N-acetyltransferase [Mesorhizobium sp. NBSH29]|uniref:GNAT family N-acetyltransferase n=1 Tax=Mesorhizobium sp. NBSH29 TaxID=2654249 RepID=UPI0018968927|nr:N-acetyltransferase [Mesorhizobium sp. NBSH29]
MEIQIEETDSKGRYFFVGPNGAVAELTFSKTGAGMIIIDHTGVPEALRGQGAGLKLLERVVSDARSAGKTIIPLCPFAAAQFKRHPGWADVRR